MFPLVNCDFSRNSGHTVLVNNMIEDISLSKSWEKFHADFTYFQEVQDRTFTSLVDHFFWSEGLTEKIRECGVIHLPDNSSDHSPIYCIMKAGNIETQARTALRNIILMQGSGVFSQAGCAPKEKFKTRYKI